LVDLAEGREVPPPILLHVGECDACRDELRFIGSPFEGEATEGTERVEVAARSRKKHRHLLLAAAAVLTVVGAGLQVGNQSSQLEDPSAISRLDFESGRIELIVGNGSPVVQSAGPSALLSSMGFEGETATF
jgi:hypothetical protein